MSESPTSPIHPTTPLPISPFTFHLSLPNSPPRQPSPFERGAAIAAGYVPKESADRREVCQNPPHHPFTPQPPSRPHTPNIAPPNFTFQFSPFNFHFPIPHRASHPRPLFRGVAVRPGYVLRGVLQ